MLLQSSSSRDEHDHLKNFTRSRLWKSSEFSTSAWLHSNPHCKPSGSWALLQQPCELIGALGILDGLARRCFAVVHVSGVSQTGRSGQSTNNQSGGITPDNLPNSLLCPLQNLRHINSFYGLDLSCQRSKALTRSFVEHDWNCMLPKNTRSFRTDTFRKTAMLSMLQQTART